MLTSVIRTFRPGFTKLPVCRQTAPYAWGGIPVIRQGPGDGPEKPCHQPIAGSIRNGCLWGVMDIESKSDGTSDKENGHNTVEKATHYCLV
jgi:hypothetical protein